MGPGIFCFDQTGPDGVFKNVVSFIGETFIVADAMVEEVALPLNARLSRCSTFEITDDFCRIRVAVQTYQRVEMIGHEEKYMQIPLPGIVVMAGSGQKCF